MLGRILQILLGSILLVLPVFAKSAFEGTWTGKVNDLPAVKLTISEDSGKVTGVMTFYFQSRGADGKWRVVEKQDGGGPILVPRIEEKTLTFQVRHHKTHGGSEYGPNKKYAVELTGGGEARMRDIDVPNAGKGLLLTREE
jgi:hypothetical protein